MWGLRRRITVFPILRNSEGLKPTSCGYKIGRFKRNVSGKLLFNRNMYLSYQMQIIPSIFVWVNKKFAYIKMHKMKC